MKRRSFHLLGALLPLGLAACGPGGAAPAPAPAPVAESPSVTLTPRFIPGQRLTFEHVELSSKTQTTPLHNVAQNASETRSFEVEVVEAEPDGVVHLRLTMRRVAATLTSNGVEAFVYDSATGVSDGSPPARARDLVASIVADVRVAPEGTVLTMKANITAEEVRAVPAALRPLLAENWFRSVIEQIYRPLGEPRAIATDTPWTDTEPAPAPFPKDNEDFVRTSAVTRANADAVRVETETILVRRGVPDPESYLDRVVIDWDPAAGRLEHSAQRQTLVIQRELAGAPAVETLDRQFLLRRVNPDLAIDDMQSSDR